MEAHVDVEHGRPYVPVENEHVRPREPKVEVERQDDIAIHEQREAAAKSDVEGKGMEVDERIEIGVAFRGEPPHEPDLRPLRVQLAARAELQ